MDKDKENWNGADEDSMSQPDGEAGVASPGSDGLTSDKVDGLTSSDEDDAEEARFRRHKRQEEPSPERPQDFSRWGRLRDLACSMVDHAHITRGLSKEAVNMVHSIPGQEIGAKGKMEVRISFCVACFGRGWQLRTALAANLLVHHDHQQNIRFCVALYNSGADGEETKNFIQTHFQEELASGFLVVRYDTNLEYFHSSICKNAAHKVAIMVPWGHGFVSSDGLTSLEMNWYRPAKSWDDVAEATYLSVNPTDKRRHVLINLDADNILSGNFPFNLARVQQITNAVQTRPDHLWGFRCVSGGDSGCTGCVGLSLGLRGFISGSGFRV